MTASQPTETFIVHVQDTETMQLLQYQVDFGAATAIRELCRALQGVGRAQASDVGEAPVTTQELLQLHVEALLTVPEEWLESALIQLESWAKIAGDYQPDTG